jgi:hypothetical protein
LGYALTALGAREGGTAKLEEAVVAYREALKEWTRERAPLNWAINVGNGDVPLMLLAVRRGDVAMAETALSQINAALETLRTADDAPSVAILKGCSPGRALSSRVCADGDASHSGMHFLASCGCNKSPPCGTISPPGG